MPPPNEQPSAADRRKRTQNFSPDNNKSSKKLLTRRRSASAGDPAQIPLGNHLESTNNTQVPKTLYTAQRKEQNNSEKKNKAAVSTLILDCLPAHLHNYVAFCKTVAEQFPVGSRAITSVREIRDDPEDFFPSAFSIRGPQNVLEDIFEQLKNTVPFKEARAAFSVPKTRTPPVEVRWITLKGVTTSASAFEILTDLKQQIGPAVQYAQRLHHTLANGKPNFKRPLPIVRVRYTGDEAEQALLSADFRLFGVLPLSCSKPQVEPSVPHCKKCLEWGHGAKGCRKVRRCAHCGENNHAERNCPNYGAPSRCANCLEEHHSWYRGCGHFKQAKALILAKAEAAKRKARQQRQQADTEETPQAVDDKQQGRSYSEAAQSSPAGQAMQQDCSADLDRDQSESPGARGEYQPLAAQHLQHSSLSQPDPKPQREKRGRKARLAAETAALIDEQNTAAQISSSSLQQQHAAYAAQAAAHFQQLQQEQQQQEFFSTGQTATCSNLQQTSQQVPDFRALQHESRAATHDLTYGQTRSHEQAAQNSMQHAAAPPALYASEQTSSSLLLSPQQQFYMAKLLEVAMSLGLSQGEEIACNLVRLIIGLARSSQLNIS